MHGSMIDTQLGSGGKGASVRLFMNISAFAMMFMMVCIAFLSMVGMFVTGWALYGWLLRGDMKYAEHWSAEERRALNAFESALRFDNNTLTELGEMYEHWVEAGEKVPAENSFAWAMRRDICTLPHAKKWNTMLREFVAAPADVTENRLKEETVYSLPHIAAEMGHWEAMKVFVARGYQVNKATKLGNTLLSVVLCNMSSLPQEEIFAVAEWLVSQGAEVKADVMLYEAVSAADDEGATLEWLLEHGMPLEICSQGERTWLPVEQCVSDNVAMDVFVRLVNEGRINVNDTRSSATYLQLAAVSGDLEVVEQLLALGADTELLAEHGTGKTAVAQLLDMLAIQETVANGDEELQKLRLLLKHKAQPQPLPDKWVCQALKDKTEALLLEFEPTPQEKQNHTFPES